MTFSSPISGPLRALGSWLAAMKLLGRKFRNNGRHAMRGKVVRTAP